MLSCAGAGSAWRRKSLAGVELRTPGDGGSMGVRGDTAWRDEDAAQSRGVPQLPGKVHPPQLLPPDQLHQTNSPGPLQGDRACVRTRQGWRVLERGHRDSCIPQTQDTRGLVGLGEWQQAGSPDRRGIVSLAIPHPQTARLPETLAIIPRPGRVLTYSSRRRLHGACSGSTDIY